MKTLVYPAGLLRSTPRFAAPSTPRPAAQASPLRGTPYYGCVAEQAFQLLIERIAEVCWEAKRAWIRSEFDSSTACDVRVPRKWIDAGFAEQQSARAQVLRWWAGEEAAPNAPVITRVCRELVVSFKAVSHEGAKSAK